MGKRTLWIVIMVIVFASTLLIPVIAHEVEVAYAKEPEVMKLKNMSAGDNISFAGRTWIVLNPEDGYIFSDDSLGKRAFDLNDKTEFDPNDSNNIGHYLNQTYYEGLTTQEQEVIQNTDWDIGTYGKVTANIGLLSVDEWSEYKPVIGNPAQLMWLRTPFPFGNASTVVNTGGNTNSGVSPSSPNPAVHPALILDPEIFVSHSTKVLKNTKLGDEFIFANATWIVLDPAEGYILRKNSLRNRLFDNNNKNQFNPGDESNIAYYLNETFYKGLTSDEQDAIKEREWTLENESNQQTYNPVKAKVGLLSKNEWETFKDEISFLRNYPEEHTWLRTPRFANNNFVYVVSNKGTTFAREATFGEYAVRPALTIDPQYAISPLYEVFITKVTFTSNGNDTWAGSHSVTVNVTNYDFTKPLQYVWSTDTDIPVEENDWKTFTNNTEITTPEGASGKHYLHVRGTAKVDNDSIVFHDVSSAFNVDNTNPSLPTINVATEWTNNQEIGISHGTENDSGVARTEYKIGPSDWKTWPANTEEIKINTLFEGNIEIQAKTIDLVGNESEIAEKVAKIDYTPPELAVDLTQGEDGSQYTSGDWTKETVNVSVQAEDTLSGLEDFEISINGEDETEIGEGSFSHKFEEGVHELNIRATDLADNETIAEHIIKIDKTNPSEPSIQLDPDGWTNADKVAVTITDGTDEESGVAQTEYRLNGESDWVTYETPFDITNEGETTVYARTIDNAGNVSDIAGETAKIKRSIPDEPSIHVEVEGWTNEEKVTVTITGADEESKIEYQLNGLDDKWLTYHNSFDVVEEGITPIYARIIDQAGNISEVKKGTVEIDRTPPELTLSGDNPMNILYGESYEEPGYEVSDKFTKDLNVDVTGAVDTSKIGSHELTYRVKDQTGNETISIRTVNVNDEEPPVITIKNDNPLTLEVGTIYEEPGATAKDNYDGDLTEDINIIGKVNTDKVGTYQLKYTVKDSSGNISSTVREIIVIDTTAPTDMKLFAKDQSINSVTLEFSAYDLSGIKEYILYRNGKEFLRLDGDQTTHTDKDLQTGKNYAYKLVAIDFSGNKSEEISLNISTDIHVSVVHQVQDIKVSYDTELKEIPLPDQIKVTLTNEETIEVPVHWNEGNPPYDKNNVRSYIFSGEFILPKGVTNPSNKIITTKVIVGKPDSIEINLATQPKFVYAGIPVTVKGTNTIVQLPSNLPKGTKLQVEGVETVDASGIVQTGGIYNFVFTYPDGQEDFIGDFILTLDVHDNVESAAIYYYNKETNDWEYIGGNMKDGRITAIVNHFSTYGVFTKEDEIPVEQDDKQDSDKGGDTLKDEEKEETKDNGLLPSTASSIFNWLLFGGLLVVFSSVVLWLNRKKEQQEKI